MSNDNIVRQINHINTIEGEVRKFMYDATTNEEQSSLITSLFNSLKINMMAILGENIYKEAIKKDDDNITESSN